MNFSDITDNKGFWKTMKPVLSNKTAFSRKISLKEGDEIVSDDIEVANTLHKTFVEAVPQLSDKKGCSKNVSDYNSIDDPLENITHRLKKHPSIINEKAVSRTFNFRSLTEEKFRIEKFLLCLQHLFMNAFVCWKLLFVLELFVTVFYFSWIYVGLFSEVLDYHICKPCKVFLGKIDLI